jgi:hypothetical protein
MTGHDFFFKNCGEHAISEIRKFFSHDQTQDNLRNSLGCGCPKEPLRFVVECVDPLDAKANILVTCRVCSKSIQVQHTV